MAFSMLGTHESTLPLMVADKPLGTPPPRWPVQRYVQNWTKRCPVVEKSIDKFQRIPPRYKYSLILAWITWKLILALIVLYYTVATVRESTGHDDSSSTSPSQHTLRILYIVTSLSEYNTGRRDTIKGQDRLAEVLLPVLNDSVQSIQKLPNVQVDVFLILAYELSPSREGYIRQHLPTGVEIWDDACPLGYEKKHSRDALIDNTRALARQHRYVVKDKLEYYDLFIAVEDDMRISGAHVEHFWKTSLALEYLEPETNQESALFYGPLTQRQIDRLIPGFVRVEVLLDPSINGAQKVLDPVPIHYPNNRHFDPVPCCHLHIDPHEFPQQQPLPAQPARDDVVIWETNIRAMAVRQLPTLHHNSTISSYLDWVALLPGPGKHLDIADSISGYWSGQDGAFGANASKPKGGEPTLIAQQGGWMATARQIGRFQRLCEGSFVPPFDEPIYRDDGQESMNVEFWSGGYQLFTGVRGGCNMQRVVSLRPEHYSKHFIYHAANNKQRQLSSERMVRADHLWGQLNSVLQAAQHTKHKILQKNPQVTH